MTPAFACGTRFHTSSASEVSLSSRHVRKPLPPLALPASSSPACLSPPSPPISVALLLLALAAHPPDRPPAEPRRPATPHTPSRARHRKPRVTQLSLPTRSLARCELRGRGRGVAAPPSKPRTVPLLCHTLQCSRAPDAHTPRMPEASAARAAAPVSCACVAAHRAACATAAPARQSAVRRGRAHTPEWRALRPPFSGFNGTR